jgi:hypothetical protein
MCVRSRKNDEEVERKGILGFEGRGERPRRHERAEPAPRGEGRAKLVRVLNSGTGSWRRKCTAIANVRARAGLNGGKRSRAGDAFRPPSPAPFAFVIKGGPVPGRRPGSRPRFAESSIAAMHTQDFSLFIVTADDIALFLPLTINRYRGDWASR